MQIRPATVEDIPRLIELGGLMHAESERFSRHPYAPDRIDALLRRLIGSPRGLVLVATDETDMFGVFVGVAAEHWACEALVASDLALFVRQDKRGSTAAPRLLCGYVAWCKSIGAAMATAGISTQVHPEKSARLYRGLGFQEVGPVFDVLGG